MNNKETVEFQIAPHFEPFFGIEVGDSSIVRVVGYEPEINRNRIVLPIELTDQDGAQQTLGFVIDTEHLKDLLNALEFPDVIGAE